jgi:hypothetical protein
MRYVQAGTMLAGSLIYVAAFLFVDGLTTDSVGPLLLTAMIWNVVLVLVTIPVIIDSILKVHRGKADQLATDVFVVKLAAIPFFVLNFVVWVAIGLGGLLVFIFGGGVLTTAALVSIGATYLAMLSTSVYGWASIIQLRRERRIDTAQTIGYSILLLVFVADIVAAILLFARARRTRREILAA